MWSLNVPLNLNHWMILCICIGSSESHLQRCKKAQAAGPGRWFFPSTQFSWVLTWNTASSLGILSARKMGICWTGSRGWIQKWWEGGKAERVGIVQSGENSGEVILWPFNTYGGVQKKKGRDFLPGPVVEDKVQWLLTDSLSCKCIFEWKGFFIRLLRHWNRL